MDKEDKELIKDIAKEGVKFYTLMIAMFVLGYLVQLIVL
jgi:hypothetical protein